MSREEKLKQIYKNMYYSIGEVVGQRPISQDDAKWAIMELNTSLRALAIAKDALKYLDGGTWLSTMTDEEVNSCVKIALKDIEKVMG